MKLVCSDPLWEYLSYSQDMLSSPPRQPNKRCDSGKGEGRDARRNNLPFAIAIDRRKQVFNICILLLDQIIHRMDCPPPPLPPITKYWPQMSCEYPNHFVYLGTKLSILVGKCPPRPQILRMNPDTPYKFK